MSYLSGTSTHNISREIEALQENIGNLSLVDDQPQRQALLNSARKLVSALETPGHVVARTSWDEPTLSAALRILIDLDIFRLMIESGATVAKQA